MEWFDKLVKTLRSLRIPSEHIIINKVIPLSACSFCSSKRKEQEKYIGEISGLFAGNAITEMPMLPGEIRGIDALSNFAEIMYGGQDRSSQYKDGNSPQHGTQRDCFIS